MTEEKLEKIKLKHIKNNLEIYQKNREIFLLYEEYIKKIVELLDFIRGKRDDLFYTIVFDILCEIGFFSFNNVFDSSQDEFPELTIKPGISVVSGTGLCRNIACFYEDIFKYFYNYPLKMCCFDPSGTHEKDTEVFGNHMINLTCHHDLIYGFDNMNHCLFKAISNEELTIVDSDYNLIYKPYGDILIRLTNELVDKNDFMFDIYLKKSLLEKASQGTCIKQEEFNKLVSDANALIIERKKILKSFLEDNMKYKEEIKEKMLLLK